MRDINDIIKTERNRREYLNRCDDTAVCEFCGTRPTKAHADDCMTAEAKRERRPWSSND